MHMTVSRAQFAAAHAHPYLPVALTTLVHAGGALRLASGTLPESIRWLGQTTWPSGKTTQGMFYSLGLSLAAQCHTLSHSHTLPPMPPHHTSLHSNPCQLLHAPNLRPMHLLLESLPFLPYYLRFKWLVTTLPNQTMSSDHNNAGHQETLVSCFHMSKWTPWLLSDLYKAAKEEVIPRPKIQFFL